MHQLVEMQLMEVPPLGSSEEVIAATHKKIAELSLAGWNIIGHTKDEKKEAIWVKVMAQMVESPKAEEETVSSLSKSGVHIFSNGVTVAEFKGIVADWPESDSVGNPNSVWSYDGEGRAGQVRKINAEAMSSKSGQLDLTLSTDGRI